MLNVGFMTFAKSTIDQTKVLDKDQTIVILGSDEGVHVLLPRYHKTN